MNKYVTNLTLPNGTNVLIKDSECRTNLSNEINRATKKETGLQQNINAEASAREQADKTLQTKIKAVETVSNENSSEIATIHNDITTIENKNTEQDNELSTLRTMLSSPYNFKGDVANISALPASGEVNDTYYVQDVKYKVTWTGSAWVQSSMSEADYQTELGDIKSDLAKHGLKLEITDALLTNSGYITLDGNVHDGAGIWFYSDPIDVRNYNNLDCSLYGFNISGTVVLNVFCKKENGAISYKLYKEDNGEGVITRSFSLDDVDEIIICSQKSNCNVIAYTTLEDYGIKSIGAISNDIVKNCIPLLNDQNGFISSNGTIQDVPNSYWRYTDYIDVKNYNRLYCKLYSMNVTCYFVGYDKNKEIISKFTGTSDSTEVIENTIDISNISYIRLCSFTADGGEINAILYNISNKNVMNEWNHVVNKPYNFNGKKALFFGDSITKGFTRFDHITENGFPKVFSNSVGMDYVNYGVGGYCMADLYLKMLQISNSEYNSSNFVFIADGVNDWQTGVPLETFKNNVISVCKFLKNYNLEVIFITPINNCGWEPVSTTVATLDEYRNIINEIALSYEYSVLQGNKFTFPNRNSDPSLISDLYGDKLHLTEKGYRLYAKNLKTILC